MDEVQKSAKKKKRIRPPKPWMVIAGIGAIFACILIIIGISNIRKGPVPLSEGTRTESLNPPDEGVVGGESTEAYSKKIEEENQRQSQKAKEENRSFIPVPVRNQQNVQTTEDNRLEAQPRTWEAPDPEVTEEDIEELKEMILSLRSDLDDTRNTLYREIDRKISENLGGRDRQYQEVERSRQQVESSIETVAQRYSDQMKQIAGIMDTEKAGQKVINFKNQSNQTPEPETDNDDENKAEDSASDQKSIDLSPGDILYARNELQLNSDAPGPVHATVLSQKLQGSKLLGQFSKHEDYLTIEFSRLVTTKGEVHNIQGVAIDPAVSTTAVRSNVNRRILQRWGGLMAASFLTGYGKAVTGSGSEMSVTDGQVIHSTPQLDTQQELWAASGEVGERLEEKFAENFNRPSTVTFDPGAEMGVLILQSQ